MGNKILALDLGTTTGWAIGTNSKIISGIERLKPSKFDSYGIRYLNLNRMLDRLFALHNFTFITYEEVRSHAGVDASHMYGGYMAIVLQWALLKAMDYEGIPVGTIKKHITGKGNANKDLVMQAVIDKFNIIPKDDNEADAIALCDYVLRRN